MNCMGNVRSICQCVQVDTADPPFLAGFYFGHCAADSESTPISTIGLSIPLAVNIQHIFKVLFYIGVYIYTPSPVL
jgi:hypothetical protein